MKTGKGKKERSNEERARDVANDLLHLMNCLEEDGTPVIVREITRSHRTLQQGVMRLVVRLLESWAKAAREGNYDLRNEATVKAAERMVEAIKGDYFPLI